MRPPGGGQRPLVAAGGRPRGSFCEGGFEHEGGVKVPGAAEGRSPFTSWSPLSHLWTCDASGGGREGGQGVLWASGLEGARQFVKAFGERGGDLHVAEGQDRQVGLMPLDQPGGRERR